MSAPTVFAPSDKVRRRPGGYRLEACVEVFEVLRVEPCTTCADCTLGGQLLFFVDDLGREDNSHVSFWVHAEDAS